MQPVMQDLFAQGINVEEGRPGMMKPPSRIIAEQFVEMLGTLDLKSVRRKICVLEDWNGE
jgi:hypothetical protein